MGNETKPRKPGTFKPGQSGNPSGRPKLPKEIKQARELNQTNFISTVNKYLYMNKAELAQAAANPNMTALELMVLKILQQAILKGDQVRLNFLLDRVIGKTTDKVEATNLNIETNMSEEDLIKKVKEKLAEIESEHLNS